MAISKNIVDMMGGTIAVKSEQGKGSEFTVTLDCKVCTESVKYPPIPGLKGTRALVVDDDAQTCMSVSKMLREIEMEADWTTPARKPSCARWRHTIRVRSSRFTSLTG